MSKSKKVKPPKFRVGDRVHWTDPDEDICSCDGNIVRKGHNCWIVLQDGGGEVEALTSELSHIAKAAPTPEILKAMAFEKRQSSRLTYLGYLMISLTNLAGAVRHDARLNKDTKHLYELGHKRLLSAKSVITKMALDIDHQFRSFRV